VAAKGYNTRLIIPSLRVYQPVTPIVPPGEGENGKIDFTNSMMKMLGLYYFPSGLGCRPASGAISNPSCCNDQIGTCPQIG